MDSDNLFIRAPLSHAAFNAPSKSDALGNPDPATAMEPSGSRFVTNHSSISAGFAARWRSPDGPLLDRGLVITFAGMFVVALLLFYRVMGLLPTVMADEWAYSLYSRHLPFSASPMPSYLYFWLFRHTNYSGSSYLECARLFNCVLLVSAAPFIYKVARQVTTPAVASFIALVSICAPINTYTAYFMPEAMYFAAFWALTWILFSFRQTPSYLYGSLAGIALAGLSMIKVHGLFLFPGVAVLIAGIALASPIKARFNYLLTTLGFAVATFGIVRFSLGYLFAGKAGLHLLGNKYGAVADTSLTFHSLLQFSSQVPYVIAGHLMGLALLFGLPLAATLLCEWPRRGDSESDSLFLIKLYTVAVVLPLLFVMAYYTVSVVGHPYESIRRMHSRYYSFALPLLFIVAAGEYSAAPRKTRRGLTVALALPVAGLLIAGLFALRTRYSPNLVDSPEFQSAVSNSGVLFLIGGLGLAALFAWMVNRRLGAQVFLFAFLPASVFLSGVLATRGLRGRMVPDVYDRAGLLAHQVLTAEDRAATVVVGSDEGTLYRTIFLIDDPATKMMTIPAGEPLDLAKLPADYDWALVIGEHSLSPGTRVQYPMDGFLLLNRTNRDAIRFSRLLLPDTISKVTGLSGYEPIGRWSDGKQVVIEFASPLPKRFQVNIKASAFGPNVNLPFVIHVDSASQPLRLSAAASDVSLTFVTDGTERDIVIDVPQPTSPSELGVSSDTRHLGILLKEVSIVPLGDASSGTFASHPTR
jgi:phosphoglycerol transferase